jgi:hypothetical protein
MIIKTKKIPISIYFQNLIIHKVDTYVEVNKKYGNDIPEGVYSAVVFRIDKNTTVMAIEDIDYGIIAHEVVHLVNSVFKEVGIQLDLDNDEPQAYLTGYIMKQICNFLDNEKKMPVR